MLDRLDEAFLFDRSIDIETYDRHAEKLREELTLARIDRHRFIGTGATAPAFSYLREIRTGNEGLVAQIFPRWNPLTSWMRQIEDFQRAA